MRTCCRENLSYLMAVLVLLSSKTLTFIGCDSQHLSEKLWKDFQANNVDRTSANKDNSVGPINATHPNSTVRVSMFGLDFPNLDEKPFDPNDKPPNEEMLRLFRLENYNSDYLRIFRPRESLLFPNGRIHTVPYVHMNRQLDRKWIFSRFQSLPYGNSVKPTLDRQRRRLLRQFLGHFNHCPVFNKWEDRGTKFWPRWIKIGSCVNIYGSCSIPAGMFCSEDNHKTIMIFRHICLKNWPKENCKWYRVHVSVVTSCKCSCD